MGAEVIAVSQDTYQMLPEAPPLSTPQKVLCGPSRKPLQVVGQCHIYLANGGGGGIVQSTAICGQRAKILEERHYFGGV